MKTTLLSIQAKAARLAEITKAAIRNGNMGRAKKCMAVAERLLESGNREAQIAIANVYLFSVSAFMELRNCRISGLFPPLLQKEYCRQINASGV